MTKSLVFPEAVKPALQKPSDSSFMQI